MEFIAILIAFSMACYGGANAIVYSRLLEPVRNFITYESLVYDEQGHVVESTPRSGAIAKFLTKLIACPLCVGFWLGILFSYFVVSPLFIFPANQYNLFTLLADGFYGSASAWIIHLLLYDKMVGK